MAGADIDRPWVDKGKVGADDPGEGTEKHMGQKKLPGNHFSVLHF